MATQFSQMSQSERSRAKMEASNRRLRAYGLHPDQLTELATQGRSATKVIVDDPMKVEQEQERQYYESGLDNHEFRVAQKVVLDATEKALDRIPVKTVTVTVAVEPEKAFCVEFCTSDGDWCRASIPTADKARDLEAAAKEFADLHPDTKIRVIRTTGENRRAVLRFRWNTKTNQLGSY